MPRNRHHQKPSSSQFPISEPANTRRQASSSPRQDDLSDIESLLENGNFEEALARMDSAPKWMKRSPEFVLMQATTLMEGGDLDEGGLMLRELERKNPKFIPLYLPLATWYMLNDWPAHAFRAVRKVLSAPKFDDEAYEMAQSLSESAREMIQFLATTYELAFEKAEQASWYNEQAQLVLFDNNLTEVEHMAKEALAIAPNWTAPRNNFAHTLYFNGKCLQAITEAETVVRDDPDNIHGLNNLVIFHTGLGHEDKASEYSRRLFELSSKYEKDAMEIDVIISGLAITEDIDSLWKLAQRYLHKPGDTLLLRSWHCLGVAATRLGHFKEAKKLFDRSLEEDDTEIADSPLEKINAAIKAGKTKLLWPLMYPGLEILFPERQMKEWTEIVDKVNDDRPTFGQQRKINAFLEKYPFVFQAFKRLLWIEDATELGASALLMANKLEGDTELLRFAFSDIGDNNSRMHAVMMLIDAGRYTPDKTVKFWDANKEEWIEAQLFSQQIGDVEYDIKPQTADLIDKSRRTKDPQEAISLLRQAVRDDPNCAMALHNLGVILTQNGETEEGKMLMRRSVEVDPTYTFGFANLGLIEAQNGNKELALEHLMKVNQAKIIAPNTSAISNLAYMLIAIQDNDIEKARLHFDMASEVDPDNRLLDHFEERLSLFEKLDSFSFIRDYQKQSANRFHRKALNTPLSEQADLRACLSKQTNDTLSAICRFWGTQGYGKKAELVDRLTARILDVEIWDEIFEDLEESEHEALIWILDGGGWQPWAEFTEKFGDDMDESPYWRYGDPESIPGRLKLAGLIFAGKLDGQEVAFIPANLRPLLKEAL
jgi:tetratricopeptide (TPR) repeat protein